MRKLQSAYARFAMGAIVGGTLGTFGGLRAIIFLALALGIGFVLIRMNPLIR